MVCENQGSDWTGEPGKREAKNTMDARGGRQDDVRVLVKGVVHNMVCAGGEKMDKLQSAEYDFTSAFALVTWSRKLVAQVLRVKG